MNKFMVYTSQCAACQNKVKAMTRVCVSVLLTWQEVPQCVDEVFGVFQVSVYVGLHLLDLIGQVVSGQSHPIGRIVSFLYLFFSESQRKSM